MPSKPQPSPTPFWQPPLQRLYADLACDARGLTSEEARARLARHGENALAAQGRRSVVLDFGAHLRSPLVLLLLAACVVSAAMGDTTSALVIAAIVLGSVTLDFVQERRAGEAAQKLRESVALQASASWLIENACPPMTSDPERPTVVEFGSIV